MSESTVGTQSPLVVGDGIQLRNLTISGFFNIASYEIKEFNKDIVGDFNKLDFLPPIPQETNFAFFLASLFLAMIWITYITFFNSRVVGSMFTSLINKFVQVGYVKIGSLSFSVMAGKVMFRDFAYITPDWSVRALDGYIIFRWWRAYVPKNVSEDLSHSDTRLSVQLYGFELHVYNRSHLYKDLEEKFGLEPGILPRQESTVVQDKKEDLDMDSSEYILGKNWRDLIPVIKVDISTGKLIFGNRLLPTTLLVSVEESHLTYSTKPANTNLDHFMHFIKCNAENIKVILAESPKYTGLRSHDEAPRNMGDGFVILASNLVHLYYYMDEPGVVPEHVELLTLPSGEMVEPAQPSWGLDIKCGKGTDISYGPWADRQREFLYKFFFPPDYQPLKATPKPIPGDKRAAKRFDIRLSTLHEATIDILFSKDKETKAIHMNIAQGSYFEMTIPWYIENSSGYSTRLNGNLMKPEGTTSLAYRDLILCETLEFQIDMFYPQYWNSHQEWNFTFTASKATLNFVFVHKWFFQDLVEDWSSRSPPDLLGFVPYTWNFKFLLKEFECITTANEYNWIDTTSTYPENSHMGICGRSLSISFSLPYTHFLPESVLFLFKVSGENMELVLHLPDTFTSHHILTTLDPEVKFVNRDGSIGWKKDLQAGNWRRRCDYTEGWIDCWCVPNLVLSISFLFHPTPVPGPKAQADIGTPEREQVLLGPLRPVDGDHHYPGQDRQVPVEIGEELPPFDPESLEPDLCKVELEVGPSLVFLYGTLIRNFMHVKENLFGEDQRYTPMDEQVVESKESKVEKKTKEFDPRDYRPLNVILDMTVHDLQANLVKYCSPSEPPCPVLCVEKLVFEMDKSFRETRLQLLLSPVLLKVSDLVEKSANKEDSDTTRQGNLLLTGLQFRGHAMFSELDRELGAETLEYTWLMELTCGNLLGKVTIPQIYNLVMSLETLIYLTADKENVMKHPRPYKICQHDRKQKDCIESHQDVLCPTVPELKYKMFRVSVDLVDINIVEKCTAIRLQCCPIRLSTCNLHGQLTHQGITAIVNNIQFHQYISSNQKSNRFDSSHLHHPDIWVESGSVKIGPVYMEGALASHILKNTNFQINQHCFLQKHDRKTKKLWFLWPQAVTKVESKVHGKCACVGGCNLFGSNENGRSFFKPNKDELLTGHNVALFTVRDLKLNPGYGQSILHPETLPLAPCQSYKENQQMLTEKAVPVSWPVKCGEPIRLPPCGHFKQPRSQMSNNSSGGTAEGGTPKLLRRQRTLGRRSISSTPQQTSQNNTLRKKRTSLTGTENIRSVSGPSLTGFIVGRVDSPRREAGGGRIESPRHEPGGRVESPLVEAGGRVESPRVDFSRLVRTESLLSDALSFYSIDGDSRPVVGSPVSPRSSLGPNSMQTEAESVRSTSTLRDSTQNFEDLDDGSEATLSRSVSSTSFMSAISEQDVNLLQEQDEDFGLVNLSIQVNKPITESPLLLSSYLTHLTQLRCKNIDLKLNTATSVKQRPLSDLTCPILETLPCYEMMFEGFSCIKMFDKDGEECLANKPIPTPSHPQGFTWGEDMFSLEDLDPETPSDKETLLQTLSDMNTSKSTIIIQFRDSVDIVTSPIMLESLQRCVESLTPTFQLLHPLAVINHLHAASLDRVEEKNTLKKEKSLDLQDKIISSDIKITDKNKLNLPFQSVSRTFEKSVASSVQGSLILPKINIMVLQASVVEDSCAFSALDQIKDITCVSFLALGIKEASFKFHKTSQSKKIVQVLTQNDKMPSGKKRKSKLKRIAQLPVGNIAFESSETQLEEIVMVGSVSKIHAQLRRLKNDSSLLKDAAITAIPDHKSKVFFEYHDVPLLSNFESVLESKAEDEDVDSKGDNVHPLGFNMCETGLEGVKISISKKSSNKDKELKDFEDSEKVHEENEILQSCSNVTLADTIDLGENNEMSQKELIENILIDIEKKDDHEVQMEYDQKAEIQEKELNKDKYQGKKSKASASLKFQTVWFNFAAPPKTPISKKIDFTKLDWNLLSTGSPAIDAWLNPINRVQNATSSVINSYNSRVGAIIASVMTEALEARELHFAKSSKYEILTALAKTLKEDPSCQLCCVMLRYVKKKGLNEIESNLDPKIIPPLTHLRQGIVVLSRQWKNVIYTPILIEYNLKTSGMKNLYRNDATLEVSEELDDTSDEEEGFSDLEMDEDNPLLKTPFNKGKYFQEGSIISNLSYFKPKGYRSPGQRSPNSDDMLFLLENGEKDRKSTILGGSIYSDDSLALKSAKSDKAMSGPSSPVMKAKLCKTMEDGEDLYHWMKRQQYIQDSNTEGVDTLNDIIVMEKCVKIQVEEDPNPKDIVATQPPPPNGVGNAFLDSHIIFEPLLSSLGLMPQQITNLSLKNLGSQIIVCGGVDTFEISLVESEFGKDGKDVMRGKSKLEKLSLDSDNLHAFVCKKVALSVDLKKVTDILKGEKETKEKVLPLYVSRNQLKRHTSSFANFTIEIGFISQKVNMPLLRLVNQIVTMHLNAKETNEVLREKKQSVNRTETFRKHKKQNSSGSSASEVGSVLVRPEELSLKGSSVNLPSQQVPIIQYPASLSTPSPSATLKSALKSRPKSFASKFRPNSRLGMGGYASLGESPLQEPHDAFIFSGHPLEKIAEEQITKCWKTIYHLLELYATLPETKFISQRASITHLSNTDISLLQRSRLKYAQMMSADQMKSTDPLKTPETDKDSPKILSPVKKEVSFAKPEFTPKEHIPLIVIGEARINKVYLMASLSGLKLEGEITNFSSSVSYKERTRGVQKGVIVDAQVNGKVDETTIALLEGTPSHQQTVVHLSVQSSEVSYKTHIAKKDKNDCSLTVGPVHVKIPQHPVTLHGIMARSSKQLTNTLKEFKGTRILYKGKTTVIEDHEIPHGSPMENSKTAHTENQSAEDQSQLLKPLVMSFYLQVVSFAVSAALLPSLQAEYKMEKVVSKGMTGSKAKFNIILPKHTLSFNTKLESQVEKDTNLPSEASIDLPKVQVVAEYIQDEMVGSGHENQKAADGSMYSKGNYFKADAEIGELDHGLTTDMLNHLVFVQKVFMKEVNEVVQKLSGGDILVPVWTEFGDEFELHHTRSTKQLLYTVSVKVKRITLTATTPSNSAVRFETGTSELVISNRIANVQGSKSGCNKISTKAKIFLKLGLGQLIKDVIYPEAEPQFQQHAYFKTTIQLRNALEDESITEEASSLPEKEVILISLNRPLIFFQPIAVDKAILVWLSYKNAWEYWAEQRSSLNKEVLIATQQVIERVPISQLKEQISSQHIGTLFLQLNVSDIGVAIPMMSDPNSKDFDSKGAIVCTVETTSISACSAESMVSKGKFEDLCIRFAEDFNHTLDDWKPDRSDDNLLNLCTVSEGSYEVCSRTVKAKHEDKNKTNSNAKWILNIKWQMTGVDVKVDTEIGKHLSALGHTLTTLTGEEEEITEDSSISDDFDSDMIIVDESYPQKRQRTIQIENLPEFVFDSSIEPAQRAKRMREEMIEQSKIIEDLRKLGASEQTVDIELKKLSDMEAFASKDFRRDIVQKLRRQSARTQSIKEKFGWGGTASNPALPPQRGISIKGRSQYMLSPSDESYSFEESVRARLEQENDILKSVDDTEDIDGINITVPILSSSGRERKKAFYNTQCETIEEDSSSPGSPPSFADERLKGTVSPKHQQSLHQEKKAISEPNVDYVFDFKIFINYGKCILHTKVDEDSKKLRKERSSSNFYEHSGSPLSQRKFGLGQFSEKEKGRSKDKANMSFSREIATIFYIPGLDVKVHYTSKTESDFDANLGLELPSRDSEGSFLSLSKRAMNRKAVLTAWVTLQSIPEETVITPLILEFLEQALEPISQLGKSDSLFDNVNEYENSSDGDDALPSTLSYPVDVIVYFHMKSNQFRFSCLPVSRVECMLTLPSLDLVFSSKRSDNDILEEKDSFFDMRRESSFANVEEKKKENSGVGGLSVTGCLADFSIHVFHPYGGGRRKRMDTTMSPPPCEDRKDSLSVKVAFVKFHLSRSRKLAFDRSKEDLLKPTKLTKQNSDPVGKACVRFSTIVDIGKATFNYDMRRLTEILAFPKAWYRRTLVRRLFLGELKTTNIYSDIDSPAADMNDGINIPGIKVDQSPTIPHVNLLNARKQSIVASQSNTPNLKRPSLNIIQRKKSVNPLVKQNSQSWETLVLFAVKFKELEVGMNMGNVMGTVCWISKDFTSEGRLSIGSSGHKDLFIGLGLKGSSLEAKGGIIGGCINLGNIDTYIRVLEDCGKEPKHKVGAKLDAMEVRIDYMGTSVLMSRVSHLEVTLENEWQVGLDRPNCAEAGSTRRAMVFVFGDLKWDQLQMLISKSTTADLIKIYYKLEEFFVQQFKSSKRVLSILEPWSAGKGIAGVKLGKRSSGSFRSGSNQSVSHHRHWQHVLERVSGLKVKNLAVRLPPAGSIVGGRLELSGKHISLACFHGINFKAKSWALFSMKEPFISFNSEAQGINMDGSKATSVEQKMVFSLGMGESLALAQHVSMATVCKISRNYMYSPQFKSLSEWFSYAFKNSDLDQVDRFPVLATEHKPIHRDKGQYNQTIEVIFALPCLSMILKSMHIQGERPPTADDPRPTVTCTFVTEFEDHIFVTVDAEAFFFLHDLISSYVKEKDRVISHQAGGQGIQAHSAHTSDTLSPDATAEESRRSRAEGADRSDKQEGAERSEDRDKPASASSQTDWREFECQTWRLEPTVRLQSWAGRKIEPYGVDYILQRLGFSHAKTTIPKWLQRGFMDPLDKILSLIVFNAVIVVSEEEEGEETNTRRKVSGILNKSDSFGEQTKKISSGARSKY